MKKIFDDDVELLKKIAKILNQKGYDRCQECYNEILHALVDLNDRIDFINGK